MPPDQGLILPGLTKLFHVRHVGLFEAFRPAEGLEQDSRAEVVVDLFDQEPLARLDVR